MGTYFKVFQRHSDYESYMQGDDVILPNISKCDDDIDIVHYTPFVDYELEYFTIEALESGTVEFTFNRYMGTQCITSMSYSTDEGETWVTTNNTNNKSQNLTVSIDVDQGDRILWKGSANQFGFYDDDLDDYVSSFFTSDCEVNAYGNIMSLLYGDDFFGQTSLSGKNMAFYGLFIDIFNWINEGEEYTCNVVDASNLILPATALESSCYTYMFNGCTSLTSVPALPATTLADNCYKGMFNGCRSLTTAPVLPATTLANRCYNSMFSYCTSLTTAPALPATTLADYCYYYMFSGCSGLTTAPELPATTLAQYCYDRMFFGCTSLTTAPALPATTLAYGCYSNMFSGCASLNYIKALFTTTPSNVYTQNWVNGVAATGTFVKNSAATWNVTGTNGIPSGWTVETASS